MSAIRAHPANEAVVGRPPSLAVVQEMCQSWPGVALAALNMIQVIALAYLAGREVHKQRNGG